MQIKLFLLFIFCCSLFFAQKKQAPFNGELLFTAKRIIPADSAKENGINGKVYVQFVVTKTGEVNDIKVIRGIGGGCDEEAVRVLKAAPSWKPGIQNGRSVRVQYTMPIFFQLAGQ